MSLRDKDSRKKTMCEATTTIFCGLLLLVTGVAAYKAVSAANNAVASSAPATEYVVPVGLQVALPVPRTPVVPASITWAIKPSAGLAITAGETPQSLSYPGFLLVTAQGKGRWVLTWTTVYAAYRTHHRVVISAN